MFLIKVTLIIVAGYLIMTFGFPLSRYFISYIISKHKESEKSKVPQPDSTCVFRSRKVPVEGSYTRTNTLVEYSNDNGITWYKLATFGCDRDAKEAVNTQVSLYQVETLYNPNQIAEKATGDMTGRYE